jgi:para-nitrobenzyl esterase
VGPLSDAQQALASTMIQLLGGFVRSGAPAGHRRDAFWPRYDAEHERVLRFEPGATAVTEAWATEHECEFWRSLGF